MRDISLPNFETKLIGIRLGGPGYDSISTYHYTQSAPVGPKMQSVHFI